MSYQSDKGRSMPIAALLVYLALVGHNVNAQGDSLRTALRAMSQRQKELGGYENLYHFNDGVNELPLLRDYMDRYGVEHPEKLNYDYEDEPAIEKRISSAFRERMADEDRQSKLEDMTRNMLSSWEPNETPENDEADYLRELWDRYNNNAVDNSYNYRLERANKRAYYPTYGVENIGLRKRSKYMRNNDDTVYNYNQRVPREGEDNEFPEIPKSYYRRSNNLNHHHHNNKRFFVAKRSSNDEFKSVDQKRSVKKQTDPRVEKELSNLFTGANQPNLKENKVTAVKPMPTIPPTIKLPVVDLKKNVANSPPNVNKTKAAQNNLNKEVFAPVAPVHERPVKTAKKSIDWSDYFGFDRRKKSVNPGLDKEWLMERYHKAVAITAKKRSADLPLKYFRNHDDVTAASEEKFSHSPKNRLNEEKIDEFSSTLRNMEEKVIDDALKYTGAHHDDTDTAELQKVKDNIINSLAAAYNFEKMRNALEEYKNSIKGEKAKLRQEGKLISDDYTYEEKRVSVPRKEAVDESRENVDGDNNIKCTTSADCHKQTYKTPSDILDSHFDNIEQCPAIQRACNGIASMVGHYGHVFEGACNIYQMCLLCASNNWFSPTRHCNALFLDKAYEMCLGKEECQREAQKSIRYMLDINQSLQAQSALAEECGLACPEND